MIDITMKLKKDNDVWKWLESRENKLLNAGHVGTHIDVYKKSQVPLEYFKTRAVTIDCSSYGLDDEIGMKSIEDIEIPDNSFVIFNTKIQADHPYGSEVYVKGHHQLSWELIDHLTSKEVCFIGIDCAGIRRGSQHVKADVKAEERNTYVVENLDLGGIDGFYGKRMTAYTMWIENPFATGLSTRVILEEEDGQ